MIDLCQIEKLPEPVFEERSGGLVVIFRFKTAINQSNRAIHAITPRQAKIMAFLKEVRTAATKEISDYLSAQIDEKHGTIAIVSNKTALRDLQHLRAMRLAYLKGKGKNAMWVLQELEEND